MGRGKRLSVDQGLALIRDCVRRLGSETVGIERALGRVTAAPIVAQRTVPSFRAAAMDGFAVRSADVAAATPQTPVRLPISAKVPAGTWPPSLGTGKACGIATGAPVPEGADCIVMIEHVEVDAEQSCVAISAPARSGLNVREIGEDAIEGKHIAQAGLVITPDVIAGLAAYGLSKIEVVRSPRLALVVTGSELVPAQDDRAGIVDSNGPMIRAYAASIGMDVQSLGPIEDTAEAVDQALDQALSSNADIILTSGGASHGERDCVLDALTRRNARILFHGLSMRPGKPIIFALLTDGRPFFGLPGNPVSACIGMRFFVFHALRAMLDLPEQAGVPVESDEPGREGVTLFLRGRLSQGGGQLPAVDTGLDQRSHVLSSLMQADTWIRVDREQAAVRHLAYPKALRLTV
jgi:molybdopterin molybdotransferase